MINHFKTKAGMFSETVLSEGIAIVRRLLSHADSDVILIMHTLRRMFKTPARILLSVLTLSFPLLLHSALPAYGQSTGVASYVASKDLPGKSQVPGLAAAKIPQGLDFPNFSEKTYGDTTFELGGEFDKNGWLIQYSTDDSTMLKIVGNQAMILKAGETKVYAVISPTQNIHNTAPLVQDLVVMPAILEVTAESGQAKLYGSSDPEFKIRFDGFVYGEGEEVVSGHAVREIGEDLGYYNIERGDLDAGGNYQIQFFPSQFEIQAAELAAILDPTEIQTSWSVMPELPESVSALTTDGQLVELLVNWDTDGLNLLESGVAAISGSLQLPTGVKNSEGLNAIQQLTILPKPSPEDLLLSQTTLDINSLKPHDVVAHFTVVDLVDEVHTLTLVGGKLDNAFFRIDGLSLVLTGIDQNSPRNQYSILVQVLDRAGNRLEKQFELKSEITLFREVVVHNVFTPNSDGHNDTWGVAELSGVGGIQIKVFDKNGTALFLTENPEEHWDGTYAGKSVPTDIYFWMITSSHSGETRRGYLSLLRR